MSHLHVLASALALLVGLPVTCQSQTLFNFVEDGTGNILATLVVNELPADELSDIGQLIFTEDGDDAFGFGSGPYQGQFDDSNLVTTNPTHRLIQDEGVLTAIGPLSLGVFDFVAPPSRFANFVGLNLSFSDSSSPSSTITATFPEFDSIIRRSGRFVTSVPEPTSAAILGLALSCFSGHAIRRGR